MIQSASSAGSVRPLPSEPGELAEIHSVGQVAQLPKSRPQLTPGEEAASLPAPGLPVDPLQAVVKQCLGAAATFDNPVWRGDPIPVMRSLQRLLVAHSLTLEEGAARMPMMSALKLVESAVQMRLRLQQMRRSDADPETPPPEQDDAQEKAA
ncbi:hypothetical protein [Herbaspirillum sp. alder98]|uniref:hypothetical protein n=1 Tax=Herbaspirillum sp. alder98 TaxID=2913096 RepID=UPI001CD8F541|nr:hypothetical protein [Herbaspirillum sp. alder98]MCA1325669.1 hypothetical protein [Herbaspirillum sp. alder98]